MKQLQLGDVTIDRIVEMEGLGYEPTFFFPDATMEGFLAELDWLAPHFWDVEANTYIRSFQSYLVRTRHHTILVDACIGNDKERPSSPAWHHLKTDWMDKLTAAGVRPEEIDYVLCTHLHADHVGWNTRLVDGRWVPTFPNAKYICHRNELDHWASGAGDGVEGYGSDDGSYEDSVLPVVEAGLMEAVGDDFSIDDEVTLIPTPGHSPGHSCFDVRSKGGSVVISGDALHHPIQVVHPEWNSRFCMDGDRSRATRKAFVESYADTGTLLLSAHFPSPTAGHIVGHGGGTCRFSVE